MTDKINSLNRENKNLEEDLTKSRATIAELMRLSNEAKDDNARKILVERTSELNKLCDNKLQKLRDNNNSISHFKDKLKQLIRESDRTRFLESDTVRNILSVDTVQQEN
jgi:soluble cytochrome b562